MKLTATLLLGGLLATSCASINGPVKLDTAVTGGDRYVYRGVNRAEGGVLQPEATATLDAGEGNKLAFSIWNNLQLSGDSGDAAFPDGNGGVITETDQTITYLPEVEGADVQLGLINYEYPNTGLESTNEVFGIVQLDKWDLAPTISFYYDFDEVEGFYLRGAVTRHFPIDDRTSFSVGSSLALADDGFAEYYYGEDDFGIADLTANATVMRALDSRTTLTGSLNLSTMVDSDFNDSLDDADIEPTLLWLMLSIGWTF